MNEHKTHIFEEKLFENTKKYESTATWKTSP